MKRFFYLLITAMLIVSCHNNDNKIKNDDTEINNVGEEGDTETRTSPIIGAWQLTNGTDDCENKTTCTFKSNGNFEMIEYRKEGENCKKVFVPENGRWEKKDENINNGYMITYEINENLADVIWIIESKDDKLIISQGSGGVSREYKRIE